jgi:hypothetical protein
MLLWRPTLLETNSKLSCSPNLVFLFSLMIRHRRGVRSLPAVICFLFERCPAGELHAPPATCFFYKNIQARGAWSSLGFFFLF